MEEESDFPDSHLPFLPGRGRRNEIRQGWMDDTSHGQGAYPKHVKDQCEFKGFANLSAPIRDTSMVKNFPSLTYHYI